jgi:RNA polymerase sigma factor (sigma-70 family)
MIAALTPQELVTTLATSPPDHPDRAALRDRAIEAWLPLAWSLARRYHGRGEPADDLSQVAVAGLIESVDRFRVDRGADFICYAIPTVLGALRRYFRDRCWSVRVPRPAPPRRLRADVRHRPARPPAARGRPGHDLLLKFLDRVTAAGRLRVPPTFAASLCQAAATGVTLSLIGTPAPDRNLEISVRMRETLVNSLVTDPPPDPDPGLASRALALDAALTTADEPTPCARPKPPCFGTGSSDSPNDPAAHSKLRSSTRFSAIC